ncbi:MAG: hypothetical protein JW733_01735 [Coriobacteriia bacterium]|nr:hypothetical protein [Coriobacteriia bacterium]MBN2848152.1 hypothetical protein [Coriobacteriia bacterium]
MSFGSTTMYIYAYIAFALVYLIGSAISATSALRISLLLSRSHSTDSGNVTPAPLGPVLGYGRRLVDCTQAATVLPLVYIVGSMFLGSLIARDPDAARAINVAWVVFTLVCAAASIVLAALALKAYRQMGPAYRQTSGAAPDALQRVGVRLGVSAALLLVVAAFTLLNAWSVVGDLGALQAVDFLL